MKLALYIICVLVIPPVIMGLVSSYRAGQKPLQDLYRAIKKFAQRKNK